MELEKTKLKIKNFLTRIFESVLFKKAYSFWKKYYLIILFLISLLIFLYYVPRIFFHSPAHKTSFKEVPNYIIISYNKILYTSDKIKNKNIREGINAYESGYIEKAKFLFNSALNEDITKIEKIAAYVNLANIFDDANNFDMAIKYLNNALKIKKNDFIIYHNKGIVYKHKKMFQESIENLKLAIKYNNNFVKSYLSLASVYFYLKQYTDALRYFRLALAINPDSYIAQFNSAVVLLKLNREQEAVEAFKALIGNIQTPSKIKAYSSKMLGSYFAVKGDYNKALHYYKIAVEYYKDFDLYYKIGMIYKFKGEYEKALDNLKKAYIINNDDKNVIENLAKLYYRFGDLRTSLKYYKYLLKYSENKAKIYMMLGEINYRQGYLQDAADNYLRAVSLSLSPDEAKVTYINLGNIYYKLKSYEMALNYYNKALELDKTDSNLYYNIGLLYVAQNNFSSALRVINKGLEINPDDLKLNLLLPRIYLLNNDKDRAMIVLRDLIEKYPDNSVLYFEIAKLFYNLKKYDEALNFYKRLEKQNIDKNIEVKLYLNIGIIYLKKGMIDDAARYLERAYMIHPLDALVNYNLGLLNYRLRDYDKAMEYFRTVLRLDADDNIKAMTYLTLGNIYYKKGKYLMAEEKYKKAIKHNSSLTEAYYNLKLVAKKIQDESKKNY